MAIWHCQSLNTFSDSHYSDWMWSVPQKYFGEYCLIFLCKTKIGEKKKPPICRTMKTSLMLTILKKNLIFEGILANNIIFSHIMNIPFAIHWIYPCSHTYSERIQDAEKLATERNQQINLYAFNRLLHIPSSFKLCMSICFSFFFFFFVF